MKTKTLEQFRQQLLDLAARMGHDLQAIEEQARTPPSGQAAGELTNAPMHLGDSGTEEFLHGVNATLLSNEEQLSRDVIDALHRIKEGSYGNCENCGKSIPEERLQAIPYARYCVSCANEISAGDRVNFNTGRPRLPKDTLAAPSEADAQRRHAPDRRASGTAGGGTEIGGVAGTNLNHGDPSEPDIEDAT
jgi:RNA polymerase-binding transcription factor DksA